MRFIVSESSWLLVVLLPYLVDKALDDGEAAGPDSVEGEEDIVSLDWDNSPRVSRHVLLLIIDNRARGEADHHTLLFSHLD